MSRFSRNDIVKYWFDTGARGYEILYGLVVKSGPKTFTVVWESGLKNRLDQATFSVKHINDADQLEDAVLALKRCRVL